MTLRADLTYLIQLQSTTRRNGRTKRILASNVWESFQEISNI